MEAYCMKCREKREAKDLREEVTRNGKPVVKGVCSVCGTKVCKIGSAARQQDKA